MVREYLQNSISKEQFIEKMQQRYTGSTFLGGNAKIHTHHIETVLRVTVSNVITHRVGKDFSPDLNERKCRTTVHGKVSLVQKTKECYQGNYMWKLYRETV